MTAAGALVTFVVVWWLVFFMVLPFGAAPEEHPQPGNVESAPARPRLLLKALITTRPGGAGDLGYRLVHRERHRRHPAALSSRAAIVGIPDCVHLSQLCRPPVNREFVIRVKVCP